MATSSQNLLTVLKKNKKAKDRWRLHRLWFPTSSFGRLRELHDFCLVSSTEKLQGEDLAGGAEQHPAAGESKAAAQVVPTSQGKGSTEDTFQRVCSCSTFDPETF